MKHKAVAGPPQLQSTANSFWEFRAAADDGCPELLIYGQIGEWSDVTANDFTAKLAALANKPRLLVRINSQGGDPQTATVIHNRLKEHPAHITGRIDGWCCSAATLLALGCDTLEIGNNGVFMVHQPRLYTYGYLTAEEYQKKAGICESIQRSMAATYAEKTGKTPTEMETLMREEHWYVGAEAIEAGFCEKLTGETAAAQLTATGSLMVASVNIDLAAFPNIPPDVLRRCAPATAGAGGAGDTQKEESEETTMAEIKTVAELVAQHPELAGQLQAQAAEAERKRVQEIQSYAMAGFEDLIEAGIKNGTPAMEVAAQMVVRQKQMGADYLQRRDEDAQASGADRVPPAGTEGGGEGKPDEMEAALDEAFSGGKDGANGYV